MLRVFTPVTEMHQGSFKLVKVEEQKALLQVSFLQLDAGPDVSLAANPPA